MAKYPGNPKTTLNGTEFFYDTTGETGPQLLDNAPGHPRQAESDANWPRGPEMLARADDSAARAELVDIDRRSIRALREKDQPHINALEHEAKAARRRLQP